MVGSTRSYEMARRMVAAGHEVHLVTSRRESEHASPGWQVENIEGINVYWLPVSYSNKLGYLARIKAFFDFAIKSSLKTRSISADLVFATSTPLTIAIPGVLAKWQKRVPMVFEVRDLWPEIPIAVGVLRSPLTIWAARILESWAYKHADTVIGLSSGMCEGLIKNGCDPEVVHNIPNSSDVELFRIGQESGSKLRASHEWLKDRPLVVYAGTLGQINGVSYMVELAEAMLSIDPEVRFLVVGSGYDQESIRESAITREVYEKNFFMWDSISKDEVPALYSAATVVTSLFLPIREMWANSANKFFDGLAAAKPIVINYGGWQAKLLEKNGAGITLCDLSTKDAAGKLYELLVDEVRLKEYAEQSGRLGSKEFSRELLAEKLIRILEDVGR